MNTYTSSDGKSSQRNVKRSIRRPFGRLALDTSFLQRQDQSAPQQIVYPYESRTQDLTFIAFADVKARLQPQFKNDSDSSEPLQPGPNRSAQIVQQRAIAQLGPDEPLSAVSHAAALCETTPMLNQEPLPHKKSSFRRRAPKLRPTPLDLSKTDPVVTLTSRFSADTKSPTTAGTRYTPGFLKHGYGRSTPAIVITPARGEFEDVSEQRRPSSSVYSRYTDWMHRNAKNDAPPVPPLPIFLTPTDPSPRQSRGWWNIITSPFSAKSGLSFWRSPSIREESLDRMPILNEASDMGSSNQHAGVIFTNRDEEDDELRSAPAVEPKTMTMLERRTILQRSSSAPGVLGTNEHEFNIYDIPIHGLAAAYFNPHKNFPSLVFSPQMLTQSPREFIDGWSPSDSVAHPEKNVSENKVDKPESDIVLAPPGPIETDRGIFSSPAEHELRTVEIPHQPPSRSLTHVTNDTIMSPLSATPILENAHVATAFGPQSSFGEQRQVELNRTPTPTPIGLALGANTMSHGVPSTRQSSPKSVKQATMLKTNAPYHHVRQDSYGLGISGTETERAVSPPELPPPPVMSEKPKLALDRFGQLTVRSLEEGVAGPTLPWYRRFMWSLIGSAVALLILLIVLLVMFVPQKHEDMAVEAQWLRLSGFPAMPTGVTTVIQPRNVVSQNRCVSPSNLWSCANPVQQQVDQPNFRFEIRFRNGTVPKNETIPTSSQQPLSKRSQHSSRFRRSEWTDYLFSSNPKPASKADQEFLGLTTDNISLPYDGEETPFWMSLLDATALEPGSANLHKRDGQGYSYPAPASSSGSSSKNASTKAASDIPRPFTESNGKPSEQLLYPLATAQPLRLFNRGQSSEHYGFYTYFDRTIYISANDTGSGNGTSSSNTTISHVPLNNASAVCTWSQTRMLVQIWTRKTNATSTISSPSTNSSSSAASSNIPASNSTANDMKFPGSFPYPVTVTVDRHGGAASEKGVYCYGLDASSHVVMEDVKLWIAENRGVGGAPVHPAQVPGSNNNGTVTGSGLSGRDDDSDKTTASAGGIDGGTGGCSCQWQNW